MIGRNEKCPCGSEKKFKKCCIDKNHSFAKFEKKLLKNKPQSVGYINQNHLPQKEKLSQRILHMADIISDRLKISVDETLIEKVIIAWNFAIQEDALKVDRSKEIKAFEAETGIEEFSEAMLLFKEIKNQEYPNDHRMIVSHEVICSANGTRLNVASALPKNGSPILAN